MIYIGTLGRGPAAVFSNPPTKCSSKRNNAVEAAAHNRTRCSPASGEVNETKVLELVLGSCWPHLPGEPQLKWVRVIKKPPRYFFRFVP